MAAAAAAAAGGLVEDDDDEFDAYNPHPYSGGYDITAAYGAPLPPSPSTCYPVSSYAAPPTARPLPAPATPHLSSPAAAGPLPVAPAPATPPPSSPARVPRPVSPEQRKPAPPPVAEPYYWPKPHDYGDAPRAQPMYSTPEVFRGWPYLADPQCRSRCGGDYWRQCMRGLDFLFGHADGYGERRIGVDCHGVPVYANKKGGVEEAMVVEVQPPATGNVEWHEAGEVLDHSNQLSWYDSEKDDAFASAEPTYGSYESYEHPYSLHGAPEEPTWFANQSYQKVYREEASQYQGVLDEPTWFPNQSYHEIYSEEASRYQGVSDEPTWFPSQSYQEVYKEKAYQEVLSSYDSEDKISAQPIYCYNQHFGEQPLHIQVEPPETVYSHKLEYYENFSTYDNPNDIDNLEISRHSCETQPYADIPDDPLEPYKPSWSMNLGYYQSCTEGVAPEYDNHFHGEFGDMSSLFVSSFYPQQTQIYEHSHGDESVYRQQSSHSEDASRITKSGDDSNYLNGSFWPFGEYRTYDV